MKTHTVIGSKVLNELDETFKSYGVRFFEIGSKIARHHHENWNGTGYPDGLQGRDIPLCARIVAVADVFDALTSKRPYKEAFDYDLSVKMVTEDSGTKFDPNVIDAFLRAQPKIRRIYDNLNDMVFSDSSSGIS